MTKMKKINAFFLISIMMMTFCVAITPATAIQVRAKPPAPPGKNKAPNVSITNPSNGATVSGTVTITVEATDKEDGPLTPDIYIDGEFITTANSYDWDTTDADGYHTIFAEAEDSGGKTGSDSISVTVDNGQPPPPPPEGQHFAVIVGISDYKDISDLSYCDDDARDWEAYFIRIGYAPQDITMLTENQASKSAVVSALNSMVANTDPDDEIAFVTSGHGGYSRSIDASYLCMWDSTLYDFSGDITDDELAAIFDSATAGRVFIFLDHCNSGGFGEEIMGMPNSASVYLTTTCTEKGYGYDDPEHENGMWTWWFLAYTLEQYYNSDPYTAMEDAFDYAFANYPRNKGNDAPQEYDGDISADFTLW